MVEVLLAAGADKDAKKENSCTALHIASRHGHLAVVEALLAAGADKNAKKRGGKQLHAAAAMTKDAT